MSRNRQSVQICSLRIKVRAEDMHVGVISTAVVIREEMWTVPHKRAQELPAQARTLRASFSWNGKKSLHWSLQSS